MALARSGQLTALDVPGLRASSATAVSESKSRAFGATLRKRPSGGFSNMLPEDRSPSRIFSINSPTARTVPWSLSKCPRLGRTAPRTSADGSRIGHRAPKSLPKSRGIAGRALRGPPLFELTGKQALRSAAGKASYCAGGSEQPSAEWAALTVQLRRALQTMRPHGAHAPMSPPTEFRTKNKASGSPPPPSARQHDSEPRHCSSRATCASPATRAAEGTERGTPAFPNRGPQRRS